MNDRQDTSAFVATFWVLGILAVLVGPVPIAYFLTLNVRSFEGGRGYALISLIPFIGFGLLISVVALFFSIRRNQKSHKPALLGLLAFVVLAGGSYPFLEGL